MWVAITATPTVDGATVNVVKPAQFTVGANTITITVTAINGTTKTYTVNVTYTPPAYLSDCTLSALSIEGLTLSPAFSSGRVRKKQTAVVTVLGKREEVLMNQSGIVTLYFVTFDLGNDILELMVPKSYYKDLSYGDKGNLSHTGDRFNRFTVTEKSGNKTDGASALVGDTMRSSLNEIAQKKRDE